MEEELAALEPVGREVALEPVSREAAFESTGEILAVIGRRGNMEFRNDHTQDS